MAPPKPSFSLGALQKFADLDGWMSREKRVEKTLQFERTGSGRGISKPVRLYVDDYRSTEVFEVHLEQRRGIGWLNVSYYAGEQPVKFCVLGSSHDGFDDPCSKETITDGEGYEKRRAHSCRPPWARRTHDYLTLKDLSIFYLTALGHIGATCKAYPPIRETKRRLLDSEGFS